MTKREYYGTYITIEKWMVDYMGLHGDELLVFAVIYGFSQDGKSVFSGSATYLRVWIGKSKETILSILKSLREKKLIQRRKIFFKRDEKDKKRERYRCEYWATITRFPPESREKLIHNWSTFSASVFSQED